MNHKVLLADDSLTIQKVIKITLANQPYDITDCSSEDELFDKLPKINPRIVFLDFNLSDKYTGYELTSKIRAMVPGVKVLLLLGTFDTIDDASMEKSGASDKIVKPFDSNKFISICRQLIKESADNAEDVMQPVAQPAEEDLDYPDTGSEGKEEDHWQMSSNSKTIEPVETETGPVSPLKLDALSQEMADWGMSIPNVINESAPGELKIDLPPVMDTPKKQSEPVAAAPAQKAGFEIKFPENNDLDYPTIEEMQSAELPKSAPAVADKSKPQLVSLDMLKADEPMALELEGNYVEDVADIQSLQNQIADEVDENLWHADEFEDLKREVSSKIEEMKEGSIFKNIDQDEIGPVAASFAAPSQEHSSISRAEIEEMIKTYVKEYMDDMFRKNVEKISWEVIPDLAENLIRQELGKISSKIIDQN